MENAMTNLVKPCPYCDSTAVSTTCNEDHEQIWVFEANCACGHSVSHHVDAPHSSLAEETVRITGVVEVVKKWNRRASHPLTEHFSEMQALATSYLTDELTKDAFVEKVITMLDGPEQRQAMAA